VAITYRYFKGYRNGALKMTNKPLTKKQLFEMLKDLPEEALIGFKSYHYEPSGRRSRIDDNLEIIVNKDYAVIEISEEKPECCDYD
jgi:hypothetical protein